jgi:hypothetical protein
MVVKEVELIIPECKGYWGDFPITVRYLEVSSNIPEPNDDGYLELTRSPFEEEKRPPRTARAGGGPDDTSSATSATFLQDLLSPTHWPFGRFCV